MLPALVVHADWSTDREKRWLTTATLRAGVYHVSRPLPADSHSIVRSTMRQAEGGHALLGFDFPIGVPRAFARKAGIHRFLEALPLFGEGRWGQFYDLASRSGEICVERPFYPARPGGTRQGHLVQGIGVDSMDDLLRRCEFGNERRQKACSLFWTLGGNQVGRAAIAGWREVLVPTIQSFGDKVGIWPFEGTLSFLLATRHCVIAETYPADACIQVGLLAPGRGWSKRKQQDRVIQGRKLREWATTRPMDLEQIGAIIDDGFGPGKTGEDQFDALAGLLGMLDVVLGNRSEGAPQDEDVDSVEGWIFGQEA